MHIFKKNEIIDIDLSSITKVGIDDFAIKKRHTYGTLMVNQESRKITSMVASRDIGIVAQWLKQFPNLQVVTRDGSHIYRSAIELANPNIVQVSDRFHLIKGLSEALSKVIRSKFSRIIVIEKVEESGLSKKSLKTRFEQCISDIDNGMSMNSACKNNAISYHTVQKLLTLNEYELVEYFTDKGYEARLKKLNQRNELVYEVKKLYNEGCSFVTIGKKLKLDPRTVKKYIQPDFKFTIDNTSKERFSACSPYHQIIVDMYNKSSKSKFIYNEIAKLGYRGSYSMLRYYILKYVSSNKITYDLTVKRSQIISLLYKTVDKVNSLTREILMKVYQLHPMLKQLIELMYEFKGILLKTRKESALLNWIAKAEKLNCSELNSFLKGLNNDYPAVLNSLYYSESNGILEASVNKVKLVKRIMHGRCSFDLLKSKSLRLEYC